MMKNTYQPATVVKIVGSTREQDVLQVVQTQWGIDQFPVRVTFEPNNIQDFNAIKVDVLISSNYGNSPLQWLRPQS